MMGGMELIKRNGNHYCNLKLNFVDTVEHILDNGITTMISPGGSIRDQEVIETVNQRNAVMVFTGVRCFLH